MLSYTTSKKAINLSPRTDLIPRKSRWQIQKTKLLIGAVACLFGLINLSTNSFADHARETGVESGTLYRVVGIEFGDWLNLRNQPGVHPNDSVTPIPRTEQKLTATGETRRIGLSTWIEIRFGEKTGWVNAKFLEKQEEKVQEELVKNSFSGEPILTPLRGSGEMRLVHDFSYRDTFGQYWRASSGAVTDGASIPRLLWSIVGSPYIGDYLKAAILHDVYCQNKERAWRDTHKMFLQAMLANGVSSRRAKVMYFAVLRFGPRWTEEKVDCYFACAENGVVAFEVKPAYSEEEFRQVRQRILDSNLSIEEIENLANEQISSASTIIEGRFYGRISSDPGPVEQESFSSVGEFRAGSKKWKDTGKFPGSEGLGLSPNR